MSREYMLLANMNQPDAEAALDRGTAVLVTGSIEQHGGHLPLGTDAFAALTIALRVGERIEAPVIPISTVGVAHGSERSIEMRGTGWKQLIRQTMPLAKARNDRGTLEKLRFEKVEEGLKIRADRYSFMRCYWDRNYFMVIVRENDKVIRVVEEYAETQPQSDC